MKTPALAALAVAALLVSGCGGDDDDLDDPNAGEESSTASAAPTESSAPEQDAEAVIQDYFAAQRAGDAAAICALEAESWQVFKYDASGQACLDDLANNTPQTVWADPVVIVSIEESELGVDAVLQPNAGSDAQAAITLMPAEDGTLLVTRFQ